MSRTDEYRAELRTLDTDARTSYLREHSNLPGPRGNLELLHAAADVATAAEARSWLADSDEFLAAVGAVATGEQQAARLRAGKAPTATSTVRLRRSANDPRWRVREGVAMGLQRVGMASFAALAAIVEPWLEGTAYEQRAAVAAVCEPVLLDPTSIGTAVDVVDRATASLVAAPDRRSDAARALRKALAYGWSVIVAADPSAVLPRFQHWKDLDDPDVAWLVRQNESKARFKRAMEQRDAP